VVKGDIGRVYARDFQWWPGWKMVNGDDLGCTSGDNPIRATPMRTTRRNTTRVRETQQKETSGSTAGEARPTN